MKDCKSKLLSKMFIKRKIRAGKVYTLMLLSVKMSVIYTFFKKDTRRKKAPSNKTPALTKNTNMDKLL